MNKQRRKRSSLRYGGKLRLQHKMIYNPFRQIDVKKLGWKNRIIGFSICVGLAALFAILVSQYYIL